MKKKVLFFLMAMVIVVPAVVSAAFSDVPEGHWAESYINELTIKNVINGFPDGRYGPDETLTAGQFLKLIVSASLPDIDYDFVPVDFEHWAAGYLKVAENYGAVEKGSITSANIDEPISRIEVVKILSQCDINMREHVQKSVYNLNFNDISNLSALESILLSHAVANEIIGGYPDGTFKPANNLTRAEAAKILSVYMSIK